MIRHRSTARRGLAGSCSGPAKAWACAAVLGVAGLSAHPQIIAPPTDRFAADASEQSSDADAAQPLPPADPAVVAALITQLDAADLDRRERATEDLLRVPGLVYADLERELRTGALSPEATRRAESVAAALFGAAPRAAMGVQFDTAFAQGIARGVRIARLVEQGDFPARRVLREGDVIVGLGGQPVSREMFRHVIVSHDPGDTLRVDVDRAGERLTLDVELGSFEDLTGSGGLDLGTLRAAVRERLRRLSGDAGPTIAAPPAADWLAAAYGEKPTAVVPDGRVRIGTLAPGGRSLREANTGLWLARPLGLFAMPVLFADAGSTNLPPAQRVARMAELARVRALLLQQNRVLEAQIATDATLTAGRRALLQAEVLDRAEWIARIDEQMQALARTPTPEEVEAWGDEP